VAISCLEYTCSPDAPCAQLLLSRDVPVIIDTLAAAASTSPSGHSKLRVVPTVRLALTAEYYLGDVACDLGGGMDYAAYVGAVTDAFTAAGVVTIMDLHWNIASLAQTSFALDVNSIRFWTAVATRYASNPLVFYELFNEPFLGWFHADAPHGTYGCWRGGGCEATLNDGAGTGSGHGVEGVDAMVSAVRAAAPDSVLLLAGPQGFAWETKLLARYVGDTGIAGVLLVLHPYLGPWQNCAQCRPTSAVKSPSAVQAAVARLQEAAGRPVIFSEFGQYCCPDPANAGLGYADGACTDGIPAAAAVPASAEDGGLQVRPDYDGFWGGAPASYNDAVLSVAQASNVSWTQWAWVPGDGVIAATCAYPLVNDGQQLFGFSAGSVGQGSVSGQAICNPDVTLVSKSHGNNVTDLWRKYFGA